jgi:hypothetical protein
MWGKGIAYPLLGDKVFVSAPYEDPHAIWEVAWIVTSLSTTIYTLSPWPRGTIRSIAPDQRRDFHEGQLRPLDVLTRIYVELAEAEAPALLP